MTIECSKRALAVLAALAMTWLADATTALAQPAAPPTAAYAVVVGSNLGGAGQATLRYAEDDAERMVEVLTSIGGYAPEHVVRLARPTGAQLLAALEDARTQLQAAQASGQDAKFFFYYSGHARADALNLGDEQLPLVDLRQRILGLPAKLSIVVLDACQSGAFSRIKGAEPAADFSYNSVQRFNTEGVAVVASSSAQELSQESDELRSSYFTHHFLVALRGGGDSDADGRVTLSEAYRYAYNHTLANTAETQVGEQHVTLETDFKGKGEVALTQPATADARLRVPASLSGRVLVQRLPSFSVYAELDKLSGESIELALPAGRYAATLQQAGKAMRCPVVLGNGQISVLSTADCADVVLPTTQAKGDARGYESYTPPTPFREHVRSDKGDEGWIFELGAGFGGGHRDDGYENRLHDFDLSRDGSDSWRVTFAVARRLQRHLVLGVTLFDLDGADYSRDGNGYTQKFSFNTWAIGAWAQGDYPLGFQRAFNFFVRGGGGVSTAATSFDAIQPDSAFADQNPSFQDVGVTLVPKTQHFLRPYAAASIGLQLNVFENGGFQLEARYSYAPAIPNELGNTHDAGGLAVLFGVRFRTWEE